MTSTGKPLCIVGYIQATKVLASSSNNLRAIGRLRADCQLRHIVGLPIRTSEEGVGIHREEDECNCAKRPPVTTPQAPSI
jgi:hypothetical protein